MKSTVQAWDITNIDWYLHRIKLHDNRAIANRLSMILFKYIFNYKHIILNKFIYFIRVFFVIVYLNESAMLKVWHKEKECFVYITGCIVLISSDSFVFLTKNTFLRPWHLLNNLQRCILQMQQSWITTIEVEANRMNDLI